MSRRCVRVKPRAIQVRVLQLMSWQRSARKLAVSPASRYHAISCLPRNRYGLISSVLGHAVNFTRVPSVAVLTTLALLVAIAIADDVTGDQITLSVLYMFPVIIGSWAFGVEAGLMVSAASATLIAGVGFHSGHPFSHAGYFLINVASALFSFVLVTVLASRLRRALDRERSLARTDFLTGIANRTAFYEVVRREIERQRRYQRPFGLAYIDCDNFKAINDSLGHHAGDELLRTIGAVLGTGLRRTDVVARLGGDEFAVLLPETDAEHALVVMQTMYTSLTHAMAERGWVVGFSVGLASFARMPESAESALKVADGLMYQVKSDGKGKMLQQVY
jgi:diguanylate cyclase (GGDEF)-like protein